MFGQNIKYQYPQGILLDKKYLQSVDYQHPILGYTSSVGEIGIIKEPFYRSGDNGAFQGLFSKEHQFILKERRIIPDGRFAELGVFLVDTLRRDCHSQNNVGLDLACMERRVKQPPFDCTVIEHGMQVQGLMLSST